MQVASSVLENCSPTIFIANSRNSLLDNSFAIHVSGLEDETVMSNLLCSSMIEDFSFGVSCKIYKNINHIMQHV